MTQTLRNRDTIATRVAFAALFGALTFLGSLIRIPVGPVPITLQTLVVLLAGLTLRPGTAFWAMVVHLLLKLITTGEAWMTPPFGFVIAFIVVAPSMAFAKARLKNSLANVIGITVVATFTMYAIGIPYMGFILNNQMGGNYSLMQLLNMGMILFLPGDAAKAALAVMIQKRVRFS